MKKAIFIIVIIFLGGIFYLEAQKENEEKKFSPYKRFEEMRKEMMKMIEKNKKINSDFFDEFFNDDFFSGRYDPFKEINEIHKSIMKSIKEERKKIFKDSWDEWFTQRININDIRVEKKETVKEIIMEIHIPDKNAQIQIKDGYIKISYEKINKIEKEENNSAFRSYSSQKMTKILPVPENANSEKHKVEVRDNMIVITFEKK